MTFRVRILHRLSGGVLAFFLAVCAMPTHPATADEKDYGPDWPVCQNIAGSAPAGRADACTRLIEGGKLTNQHLSWAYNDRGIAWRDLGKYGLALADFNQSISLLEQAPPYINRGFLYLDTGRLTEALADFETALRLAPADREAKYGHAQVLYAMKRYPEAVKELSFLIDGGDTSVRIRIQRGDSYIHMREFDQAKLDLDFAVQQAQSSPDSWCFRGKLWMNMRVYDRAIADFSMALQLNPEHYCALNSRAFVNLLLGKPKDALKDLEVATAIDPSSIDLIEYMARAYLADGQIGKARDACERVLQMQPTEIRCRDTILRSLMLDGKFEAAQKNATELAATMNAPGYVVYRAASSYALGQYDAAAKDFAQFVGMMPEDPYALLWVYLTSRRLGTNKIARVTTPANLHDAWPTPLFRYIRGEIGTAEVLAFAEVPDEGMKRQRLGEANFYLGELAAISGDLAAARTYYQAATEAGEANNLGAEFLMPYKTDNDLEISLAKAALAGLPL